MYVVKTDNNGNVQWSKTYGGSSSDHGWSVHQMAGGDYIVAGYTGSFNAVSSDFYLLRLNSSGDTLWTRIYGQPFFDFCYSAQPASDGGFILTGMSQSGGLGTEAICLIKTNSFGDTLWTKSFDGPGYDYSTCVQQTSDGGYIITGHGDSFGTNNADMYLIKTDSTANLLWSKTYGGLGRMEGWDVRQTTDGGYIVTGWCDSLSPGHNDAFLVKTNSAGDTLWTRTYGGPAVDETFCVQQTSDGGYIIAGFENSFSGSQYTDYYLIKVDANGNGGCNELSPGLIVNTPSIPVVNFGTAVSSGAILTIPSALTGNGGAVTTLCPTGINTFAGSILSISISPNPSPGNFTITFTNAINRGEVQIFNPYGEKIFTQNIHNTSNTEIHLKNIPGGIYFVKVWDGEKYFTNKIIIQQN